MGKENIITIALVIIMLFGCSAIKEEKNDANDNIIHSESNEDIIEDNPLIRTAELYREKYGHLLNSYIIHGLGMGQKKRRAILFSREKI